MSPDMKKFMDDIKNNRGFVCQELSQVNDVPGNAILELLKEIVFYLESKENEEKCQ